MIKIKRFLIALGVEIGLLAVLNPFINKLVFSTRMNAGSWGLFAPLVFFSERYSNSILIAKGFNFLNLFIDITIIFLIALIFSLSKKEQ